MLGWRSCTQVVPSFAQHSPSFSVLLSLGSTVSAQPAGYVSGTAFADIRQFGSNQAVLLGGSEDGESFDTTGVGGGLRIGTFLHPRWSLELGVDASSTETMVVQDQAVILIYPPVPPRERKSSSSFMNVSTMVGFHPAAMGRVRLGYRAGFSFVRATYKSDYSIYPYPLAELISGTNFPPNLSGPRGSAIATILPRATTFTQKHNVGALTLGFEAAIDLASRFAIVPEVRALAFSAPGSGLGCVPDQAGRRSALEILRPRRMDDW